MATASKTTEPVVKTVEEERITLVLTPEEARVLRRVARVIGGDPDGPRGAITRISEALDAVGVQRDESIRVFASSVLGLPGLVLESAPW